MHFFFVGSLLQVVWEERGNEMKMVGRKGEREKENESQDEQ